MQELIERAAKDINDLSPQDAIQMHHYCVHAIYDTYRKQIEGEAKKILLEYISNALFDERLALRRKNNEILRRL